MELKASPMPLVSEYIASALTQQLPDHILEKSKFHFLDTIASMISGSQMLAGKRAIQFVKAQGAAAPQAILLGTNLRTTAINAALANQNRFDAMNSFFEGVGKDHATGVWESVPVDRPEFKAEVRRRMEKAKAKQKAEEMG